LAKYITAQQVSIGKQIEPIKMIQLMSPNEWEELVEEWVGLKYDDYKVERLAGAGDMGIDVSAYLTNPKENPTNYKWECYQCKRYAQPLSPSSMWIEFGKVIYYSFIKKYPIPKKYYLVGTNGIGTTLSMYLKNPPKLKNELKIQWDKKCKSEITKSKQIPLKGDLLVFFEKFDFSIFDKISPKIIAKEHEIHRNHLLKFGGSLPSRKIIEEIPLVEEDKHLRYVNQLIKAYDSDSKDLVEKVENIIDSKYERHFNTARKSFYNAEELRSLTRDNLPEKVYQNFKDDIYEGIINTSEDSFENSFKKVKAVENESTKIVLHSNPLKDACRPIDQKGVCHQLVNDAKITWVEDE